MQTNWRLPLVDDQKRPKPPDVDRAAASRAAVAARRARAAVKKQIATGQRTPLDVLDTARQDRESVEARMRVTEFLLSIPAIGEKKMTGLMHHLNMSPSKRLGGLGRHQTENLRNVLRERASHSGVRGRRHNRLFVLAGPTAVGKGTVSTHIRENYPDVFLSVSATTRAPRPGETDGINYIFVSDAEFDRMVTEGELLESATVHNAYRYGTPRSPIDSALAAGRKVLLEIDIQGARSVRQVMPDTRLIFLLPPSWDELVRRLIGRGTEDDAEQQRRLETAKAELAAQDEFDFKVINTDVAEAAQEVVDLMDARTAVPGP
ncbi:guanylate kinase [Homoserinimonas sp. OAct 916]|uniref:guanylate kinase n=1 Tax=Homoserinimonas sp. OAct 916 TaxID=2211450 RepID=UPI000DBE1996|nr:guanylate kinase [Homoserinimonas sp. OAct 916]